MTAEVAVLNKSAVALAADSAMTVTGTGKTYPTNKLFALTKYRPIGVMVYNNAEFMGIPWETLVKMHREQLGSRGQATVKDYAEDLLGFVGNEAICTTDQLRQNLLRIAADLFRRIARDIAHPHQTSSASETPDPDALISDVIASHLHALTDAGAAPSMANVDVEALVEAHEEEVDNLIDQCLPDLEIDDSVRASLHTVLSRAIKSVQLSSGFSGLVFAGFGDDELFPSLLEVVTDGSIGQVVKADAKRELDIARMGTQGAIVPFAQSEMVGRFMEGVDEEFLRYLIHYLGNLLYESAHEILEASTPEGQLTEDQVSELQNIVRSNLDDFQQSSKRFRRKRFVNPVLNIVTHLPKEELASMAEALVNLTSLKRRVSMEEETVGGPIDVAVISKGDGFIWIKRKHYFDSQLNRDYLIRQSLKPVIESGGEHAL